ncbi:MAG TPA: PorV/PorQ family protein [bacterium]|nr:PorV/PorQ family protein [bacterium]
MKHTAVLLCLVAPVLVLANTGASFLKIPVGPRVCATGEAAVAYIDDASALFYNPAGLANVPTFSALFAHNQGFLDMNQEYVAGVCGFEGLGKFGLALDYWGSGEIQGINIRGETVPGYVFSAADWSLNLGYARSFSDLSVGLGLEFVHDQQESLSTSAVAFDAGAMYETPLEGLQVGVSVSNLGTKGTLYQESYSLPLQGRLGWRYDRGIIGVMQDFIFSYEGLGGDMTQSSSIGIVSQAPPVGIAAGVECRPVSILAIRVGYRTGSDYDGFSGLRAGLGVSWHGIGVDYAYAPYGKLGASHRLAISYHGPAAAETDEE